jgi:hypothetical protein
MDDPTMPVSRSKVSSVVMDVVATGALTRARAEQLRAEAARIRARGRSLSGELSTLYRALNDVGSTSRAASGASSSAVVSFDRSTPTIPSSSGTTS